MDPICSPSISSTGYELNTYILGPSTYMRDKAIFCTCYKLWNIWDLDHKTKDRCVKVQAKLVMFVPITRSWGGWEV